MKSDLRRAWLKVKNDVIRLDNEHTPVVEIAASLGIDIGAVRAALREEDARRRRLSLDKQKNAKLAANRARAAAHRATTAAARKDRKLNAERDAFLERIEAVKGEAERAATARLTAEIERLSAERERALEAAERADKERREALRDSGYAESKAMRDSLARASILHLVDLKRAGHSPRQTERHLMGMSA